MKIIRTINVDYEIWHTAKKVYDASLSSIINDFLTDLVNERSSDNYTVLKNKEIELNKKITTLNSERLIIKNKMYFIDKEKKKKKLKILKNIELKEEENIQDKDAKKPLTMKEIHFFRNYPKNKSLEFNTNFYNNTFFKHYSEKQVLKRLSKYENEVKLDATN